MRKSKQVIVFRHDLLKTLRKGKIGAQVAHASVESLLQLFNKFLDVNDYGRKYTYTLVSWDSENDIFNNWIKSGSTKICVYVEDYEELNELYHKVKESQIPCALITDDGRTEFNNISTATCLGIGPYWSEDIDEFTKDLKLF